MLFANNQSVYEIGFLDFLKNAFIKNILKVII